MWQSAITLSGSVDVKTLSTERILSKIYIEGENIGTLRNDKKIFGLQQVFLVVLSSAGSFLLIPTPLPTPLPLNEHEVGSY